MMLAGRIANIYNRPTTNLYQMQDLREQLHDFHRTLPEQQVWSSENFQAHIAAHQAVSHSRLLDSADLRASSFSFTSGVSRSM
jgi:hypothetical protein